MLFSKLVHSTSRQSRASAVFHRNFAIPKFMPTNVVYVGAPVNEGQPITGVEKGPDAFREAGIQKLVESRNYSFEDYGNIPDYDGVDDIGPGLRVERGRCLGYKVGKVHEYVSKAVSAGNFVLTVGGDRSIGAGTFTGVLEHKSEVAVVWVGAHADCNTPATSPSGNYHGMSLAHALGWFGGNVSGFEWLESQQGRIGPLPEDQVALVGLRELDGAEKEFVNKSGLHVFTMADIDRLGIGEVMEQVMNRIDRKGNRAIHLSFDIGGCDPDIAPGTGTLARGGLSFRESHYICERLAQTYRLSSMDMLEVNIDLDDAPKGKVLHGDDPNIGGTPSVSMGMELIASALGKSIL